MTSPHHPPGPAILTASMIEVLEANYDGPPSGRAMYVADALAESGYLVPAPLTVERAHIDSNGRVRTGTVSPGFPVYRYVSEWEPANGGDHGT